MGNNLSCVKCHRILSPCWKFSEEYIYGQHVCVYNEGEYYRQCGGDYGYDCKECFYKPSRDEEKRRKGFLEILSWKCKAEVSDFSLIISNTDLLKKILSVLDQLLFDEWINDPPSRSTLTDAQVYITKLCVLSAEVEVSLQVSLQVSNQVQSLIKTISHSACNICESLELTQALYLTLMHYIGKNDGSDADAVVIAKKWTKEELTMEQLFPVEFLSILISSMRITIGKTSIFVLKMEIQSLNLLISTLINLNGEETQNALIKIILELVKKNQWTPMEAVNLLKEIILKWQQDVPIAKVLKLVEVYDISPSWIDDSGRSLIQNIDSAYSERFYQDLSRIIKKKDKSRLYAALAEIKMSQKLDDFTMNKIKTIITGVFQFSENPLKGSLKGDTQNLQNCLCQLCIAVFDSKGWWPPVKHMVQWCVLVLTGKTELPQVFSSEEDPCVIAMFAARQFYMGTKMDIVLQSDSDPEAQANEWSDFYTRLGISVRTNIRKQTDSSSMSVDNTDVIYGTLENFLLEIKKTAFSHLKRGFIIEKKCLSIDLPRLTHCDSPVADILQILVQELRRQQ